jgi:hypothetical protein
LERLLVIGRGTSKEAVVRALVRITLTEKQFRNKDENDLNNEYFFDYLEPGTDNTTIGLMINDTPTEPKDTETDIEPEH